MAANQRQPSDRELQVKGEMLTCKHFNGVQHDECRAGVNYRTLAGEPSLGCMTRIPCLFIKEPKNGPMAECCKRELPTLDEAEKSVTAGDEAMARHMSAFRIAHDDAKAKGLKKGHGGSSDCECPVCHAKLHYNVADYNGHMHAQCETNGCVSWME